MAERRKALGRQRTSEDIEDIFEEAHRQGLRAVSPPVLRVIVHENPYARVPLRRDLFTRGYDERYGRDGEHIKPLFVGAEIAKLQRLLANAHH